MYASLCGFELWLILNLPKTVLQDFPMARQFVDVVGTFAPAVHHFDGISEHAQVISFVMAFSILLILPKAALFVRWLRSDRMRNYRYLIVSPLTKTIPKSPHSFITDPLRDDKANAAPEMRQSISMERRIFMSLVILFFAVGVGLVLPWVAWGEPGGPNHVRGFMEEKAFLGGWRFWLGWSVYQMTQSSILLAMGYCVITDYFDWFRHRPAN